MTVLNGLDALDRERENRRTQRRPARYVPPPKRAAGSPIEAPTADEDTITTEASAQQVPPEGAVASPEIIGLRVAPPETPTEVPEAAVVPPKAGPRPQAARKTKPATTAPKGGSKDDGRVTAYLDPQHIDFLDDVRFSPARRRLRVDVSGSAVVRFALERLADEMKPEEVYEAIAAKPVDKKAVGRKRR